MLMTQKIDDADILCQGITPFKDMPLLRPFKPFSDVVCAFLNRLSQDLLSDTEAKSYPDIITFAFFCRKANLQREKLENKDSINGCIGRGVIFHIAPSNVPINFAYSLVAGLITGNACIVRVSTKAFRQVDILCNKINGILSINEFETLKDYIVILRYERKESTTAFFSSLCDVRIIWGGDSTIKEIRKAELPPRSFDITFADRFSFCIINADKYLSDYNAKKTAQDFYNDTYLYDQNACTAPHLIVWIGSVYHIKEAKRVFWEALYDYVSIKYTVADNIVVDKLMTICRCAVEFENAKFTHMPDNVISRIRIQKINENIVYHSCPGGSFIEYDNKDMNALPDIISRKYQTMAYIGFNKKDLQDWVLNHRLLGIDRIVPIGKTTDFTFTWDGYDLVKTLTRICNAL